MNDDALLADHRVLVCHFDGYSTALVFARWASGSLLWPGPLPDGAVPSGRQAEDGADTDAGTTAEALRQAAIARLGLPADATLAVPAFDERLALPDGRSLRVHLLRLDLPDQPKALIEAAGGSLKPLPQLRGAAALELGLLREVFNLMVGGTGRRA